MKSYRVCVREKDLRFPDHMRRVKDESVGLYKQQLGQYGVQNECGLVRVDDEKSRGYVAGSYSIFQQNDYFNIGKIGINPWAASQVT